MTRDGKREPAMVTALLPAALGLVGTLDGTAGRLAWLAPVAALPVGLALCWVWREMGELPDGLEKGLGAGAGRALEFLYLLWAVFLLAVSAWRYVERLSATHQGENVGWLFLLSALALTLWLGRGDGTALSRTGRLFLLAVGAALAVVLLLALPDLNWRNLWPPEGANWAGLPGAAAVTASLAGYGVYALCLPVGEDRRRWPWAAWGCGVMAVVLLVAVGAFGPALTARLDEPFLTLMEGAGGSGALRRGEAVLGAVLILADFLLLALLGRGCTALWGRMLPAWKGRGGWAWIAAGFLLAGILPEGALARMEGWIPAGNWVFGVLLPVIAVLTGRGRKGQPHLVEEKRGER